MKQEFIESIELEGGKKLLRYRVKAMPKHKLLLTFLKEQLESAIEYEEEEKTGFISSDPELNELIHRLLNIQVETPGLPDQNYI